jgi:hypothetical protein
MRYRRFVCKYCGDLHTRGAVPDNCKDAPPARSDYPSPMVIRDDLGAGVNGLWHPAANRMIEGRREFRRVTREHGCVELGDYRPQDEPGFRNFEPKIDEADIFNDVCDVLREHDVSVESGELT